MKFHQFLLSIEQVMHKRKVIPFFLHQGVSAQLCIPVQINNKNVKTKLLRRKHTASVPLFCVSGRQVGSCDTLPPPSPWITTRTGACCGGLAAPYGCDLSTADSEHAEGMACPSGQPCAYITSSSSSLSDAPL